MKILSHRIKLFFFFLFLSVKFGSCLVFRSESLWKHVSMNFSFFFFLKISKRISSSIHKKIYGWDGVNTRVFFILEFQEWFLFVRKSVFDFLIDETFTVLNPSLLYRNPWKLYATHETIITNNVANICIALKWTVNQVNTIIRKLNFVFEIFSFLKSIRLECNTSSNTNMLFRINMNEIIEICQPNNVKLMRIPNSNAFHPDETSLAKIHFQNVNQRIASMWRILANHLQLKSIS